MDARIRRLKLENFKGISAREIVMDGSNVSVYGQNATGKTTLFDAFTWCLFGKDSTDAQDFWVKPHDANGDEIHNLETVVELDLLVDGLPQKFRHSMEEKWVKKNGEADRVYSGNTHNYWVNDVSKSAKEYEKTLKTTNATLQKYGIKGLSGEELATMDLRKVRDYYKSMLATASSYSSLTRRSKTSFAMVLTSAVCRRIPLVFIRPVSVATSSMLLLR